MRPAPEATRNAPEPIRSAVTEFEQAQQRHIDARNAVPAAKAHHEQLARKRRQAFDAAASSGKAVPADASVEKAAAAVTIAEEMVNATARVMNRAEVALATAVAEAAPAWLAQIAADCANVVGRVAELSEELDAQLGHLAETLALPEWIASTRDRVTKGDFIGGALPPLRPRESVLAGIDVGPALARLVANLPRDEPEADAA